MTRVLGIDPGIVGAWAIVDDSGIVAVGDLPVAGAGAQRMLSAPELAATIDRFKPAQAVVERVGAMPGQGVASMFRFGRATGIVDGVIGAALLPIVYVAPATWKRAFGLTADKEASRQRAIGLWPEAAHHFARKLDHGRAEACLIALWGQRAAKAAGGRL